MKKLSTAMVVLAGLGMSASVFAAGSFNQAVVSGQDANLIVTHSAHNAQGVNVVNANSSVKNVDQVALIKDVNFDLNAAKYTTQGANVVVGGKYTKDVDQKAVVSKINLKTKYGSHNTQGVNVIELN